MVAAVPVVAGWLFHRTFASVQAAASGIACSVRPVLYDPAYSRSFASVTWQPDGIAGRLNRTSTRALLPDLLSTLIDESLP